MKEHPRETRDSVRVFRGSPAQRLLIALLTLLVTPFLLLTAAAILLLNLIRRSASSARPPAPAAKRVLSGLVSVVILNWNGRDLLPSCLESVIAAVKQDGRPHEIMVVDNGSTDGSAEYVHSNFSEVRVLALPVNRGFAGGNNEGVRAAQHDIVVLLNNDMVVDPRFLRPLIEGFGPETFAVSSRIRMHDPAASQEETGWTSAVFRRGMIDYTHREMPEADPERPCYPVFWAGGGSSAFDRGRFLALGGFSEIYQPAYVEDADLSFRAWQAGWEVLFAPGSIVRHRHRATTGRLFSASQLEVLIHRNQFVFIWKNIRSWSLLLSHCALLPWNCYRLARDRGLKIWISLLQALARLPALFSAMALDPCRRVRTDVEIFRILAQPALYFAGSGKSLAANRHAGELPRVLWMTAYLPHLGQHAGAGRIYQLLKRMSRSYRVTLLTFLEGEEQKKNLPELKSICEQVIAVPRLPRRRWDLFAYEPFREFLTPEMSRALQRCLEGANFDLIHLEYTQMAGYARREFGIPTLLTKHEVDFAAWGRRARIEVNPFRKLRWFYNYLQVLDREIRLLRNVDAVICVTDADQRELTKFSTSESVHVINTGVDLEYFRPPEHRPEAPRLVYVGAFQHEPNIDAMKFFCSRVLPRIRAAVPKTELCIVGSRPPADIRTLAHIPGVQVTGTVPDIRPYMAAASVYVVPLRLGVGIRGKILEAWSMAIPVVATSVAAAGLRYRHSENLMIADDAGRFAADTIALLRDPGLRERIGKAGRGTAEQHYGWEAISSQLDALYQHYLSAWERTK